MPDPDITVAPHIRAVRRGGGDAAIPIVHVNDRIIIYRGDFDPGDQRPG